jgi:hypothetical protein
MSRFEGLSERSRVLLPPVVVGASILLFTFAAPRFSSPSHRHSDRP